MRYGKVHGQKRYIFEDKKEFEEWFMSKDGAVPELIEDWRDGKQGDWVIADCPGHGEGEIIQLIRQGGMKHPHDRKNYHAHKGWCRTIVGTFMQNKKTLMDTDFDLHPNRYTFGSSKTARELAMNRKIRSNLTKAERIFAWEMASGKTLQIAYESAFSPKANWREDAVFLLKTKRITDEIMKNVRDLAEKMGITPEYILGKYKEIADNEGGNVSLGAVKELAAIIGVKEEPAKLPAGEIYKFPGFSDFEEVEEVERERIEAEAGVK